MIYSDLLDNWVTHYTHINNKREKQNALPQNMLRPFHRRLASE